MACGTSDESRWPHLRLLAAREAGIYADRLEAAGKDFKETAGMIVETEVVPSAGLLERLERDPRPDLVLVSDPGVIRAMRAKKLLESDDWLIERVRDKLALVARTNSPLAVRELKDLQRPEIAAIGIASLADGQDAKIAEQALMTAGLFVPLESKIQYYDNETALIGQIQSGTVQAGFIRETTLRRQGNKVRSLLSVDPAPGSPVYIAFAVCAGAGNPSAAHQFWGNAEGNLRQPLMLDQGNGGKLFLIK